MLKDGRARPDRAAMSNIVTGPRPSWGKEYRLVPHPDFPSRAALVVKASVSRRSDGCFVLVNFRVHGGIHSIRWPDASAEGRFDRLWEHSCFEVFLAPGATASYIEMNFAPGRQWAAYNFDDYRHGMEDALGITIHRMDWLVRDLSVPRAEMHVLLEVPPDLETLDWKLGLTTVIEELDGTKSYWALAHAPGPPDFHNRDCFIATLPAPERP